jgi:hypothetical protein
MFNDWLLLPVQNHLVLSIDGLYGVAGDEAVDCAGVVAGQERPLRSST